MRKSIVPTLVGTAVLCTAAFLLTACALLWSGNNTGHGPSDRSVHVHSEKIGARQAAGQSHYQRGWVLLDKKNHRLAAEEFKAAVRSDRGNAAAYNALGVSLDALGDHAKAVDAYSAALAIDHELADVHNNLGYSYLLQGQADAAIKSLKKAFALDAENKRYQNNLALAYAANREYEAAYALFKADGDEVSAHLNIARIYYRNGIFDKAAVHFAEASTQRSDGGVIQNALTAATNLAQILVAEPEEKKEERQSRDREKQMVGHGDKVFYPIPGGAVQEVSVVEIDQRQLAKVNHNSSRTHDRPVYTAAALRSITPKEERTMATQTIRVKSSELFEEIRPQELMQLMAGDGDKLPAVRIEIEVSNGNGVRHMARHVGTYLRDKGFIFMYLSNAYHFNYEDTSILFTSGYLGEAYRLSQALPGLQNLEEVPVIKDGKAEICIRIGRDLILYSSLFDQG